MKEQTPLSLADLAGAGTTLVGAIAVGLMLGYLAARYLGWSWALPAGIVLGFAGGVVVMYQRISKLL